MRVLRILNNGNNIKVANKTQQLDGKFVSVMPKDLENVKFWTKALEGAPANRPFSLKHDEYVLVGEIEVAGDEQCQYSYNSLVVSEAKWKTASVAEAIKDLEENGSDTPEIRLLGDEYKIVKYHNIKMIDITNWWTTMPFEDCLGEGGDAASHDAINNKMLRNWDSAEYIISKKSAQKIFNKIKRNRAELNLKYVSNKPEFDTYKINCSSDLYRYEQNSEKAQAFAIGFGLTYNQIQNVKVEFDYRNNVVGGYLTPVPDNIPFYFEISNIEYFKELGRVFESLDIEANEMIKLSQKFFSKVLKRDRMLDVSIDEAKDIIADIRKNNVEKFISKSFFNYTVKDAAIFRFKDFADFGAARDLLADNELGVVMLDRAMFIISKHYDLLDSNGKHNIIKIFGDYQFIVEDGGFYIFKVDEDDVAVAEAIAKGYDSAKSSSGVSRMKIADNIIKVSRAKISDALKRNDVPKVFNGEYSKTTEEMWDDYYQDYIPYTVYELIGVKE